MEFVNYSVPKSVSDSPNVNAHPNFGHVLLVKVENSVLDHHYKNESSRLYSAEHELNQHKDSGIDLYCPETFTIPAGKMLLVDLGIKVAAYKIQYDVLTDKRVYVPSGFYLYPRSSMPKHGLMLANSVGIIDSGYRGNIMARFFNTSDNEVTIESGTRLVQICLPNLDYNFRVDVVSHLEETERGEDGLGSTGV